MGKLILHRNGALVDSRTIDGNGITYVDLGQVIRTKGIEYSSHRERHDFRCIVIDCKLDTAVGGEEVQVLVGRTIIFNTDFHVFLIRVCTTVDGMQVAVADPNDRAQSVWAESDGAVRTCHIPELPGEWIVHILPFGL